MRPEHVRTSGRLVGAVLPLVALMVWANLDRPRSAADLALADRCVAWAHKTREAQAFYGPENAAVCERYFRVRSDSDAEEDEQRWRVGPHS
jgi:hypothetical protein